MVVVLWNLEYRSLTITAYHRSWISLSSSVILFNKYVLDTAGFRKRFKLGVIQTSVLMGLLGYRSCILRIDIDQTL